MLNGCSKKSSYGEIDSELLQWVTDALEHMQGCKLLQEGNQSNWQLFLFIVDRIPKWRFVLSSVQFHRPTAWSIFEDYKKDHKKTTHTLLDLGHTQYSPMRRTHICMPSIEGTQNFGTCIPPSLFTRLRQIPLGISAFPGCWVMHPTACLSTVTDQRALVAVWW